MNVLTTITCPYCGFEMTRTTKNLEDAWGAREYNRFIFTCDGEEGGCDKDFVVKLNISVTTVVHKIEGFE